MLSNQLQNSSAGIINTLQYARTFIRPAPVDAAIGGFHLFRATDEQLDWTADKLKEYKTSQVLGAHCTGIQSVYHLRQRMGLTRRTCIVGSVGATYDLKDGIQTGLISRWSQKMRQSGQLAQDYLTWCLANSSGVNLPAFT